MSKRSKHLLKGTYPRSNKSTIQRKYCIDLKFISILKCQAVFQRNEPFLIPALSMNYQRSKFKWNIPREEKSNSSPGGRFSMKRIQASHPQFDWYCQTKAFNFIPVEISQFSESSRHQAHFNVQHWRQIAFVTCLFNMYKEKETISYVNIN